MILSRGGEVAPSNPIHQQLKDLENVLVQIVVQDDLLKPETLSAIVLKNWQRYDANLLMRNKRWI